jgi:hypothetical protein
VNVSTARLVSAAGLLSLTFAWPAQAAPLDALLTATPERTAPHGYLELVADRLNNSLDFSSPSADDPQTSVTRSGKYSSEHLAGAWRVADGLWLSGSLWQRKLGDEVDTYRYRSWQASGMYRFNDAAGALPAVALRLSAWGNRADSTETTTPVRVPGAVLDTVTVSKPSDRQLQADLIGTWKVTPAVDISAQLGVGNTRLSYGSLSATTTINTCSYNLSFNGNDIFGQLAEPCNATGGVIEQFYDSSGRFGVDVDKELAWRGTFMQAGINAAWRSGDWTLQGGYLYHTVRRDDVDDILASRGAPVYQHNNQLVLEGGYQFHPNLGVFVRSQTSSNLFLDELPVTYNSSTSSRFGNRFSTYTLGLRATF